MINNYVLMFLLLALFSCNEKAIDREILISLIEAKENRSELEKVLAHYSASPSDSLKLRSAKFLISNMRYKYSVSGKRVEEYDTFLKNAFKIEREVYTDSSFFKPYIQTSLYINEPVTIVKDIETIKADYIINNIESAFKNWEKPWAKHLDFDLFLELLLPYRIGTEPIEDWRNLYSAKFSKVISVSDSLTSLEACELINNKLIEYPIHIAKSSYGIGDMRPSTLIDISFGLCSNYAYLSLYSMRSLGIPVALQWIPRFSKRPSSHTFNMVLNNDHTIHDFSGAENNPDEHLVRFDGVPKIYRQTFGIQKESLPMICGDEDIPTHLNNCFLKDETANYKFLNPVNIKVEVSKNKTNNKIVYISVFDVNGWYPIGWSKIVDSVAEFKSVGANNIYCVTFYEDGKNIPIGYPFEVNSSGEIMYCVPNIKDKTTLRLERKYPYAQGLLNIPNSIIGGEFQASNSPDFKNRVTLHRINTAPNFEYTTIFIEKEICKYKYYRYIASDSSRVNMAEIEFYKSETNELINGEVIGTEDMSPYAPNATRADVFDGDPLTFVQTKDTGGWIGIKLDSSQKISKIRFLIRNGDNGIRKGQLYELLYAVDSGWSSMGKQKAKQDNFIDYNYVPKDGLYWLRNLTKGKEERIFIMNEKKQIWY